MGSISWLQLLTYVAYLFIVAAYTVKAIKYARMPMHLRWELYPVAHEKGREYGGSYFEELEWWTKPQRKSLIRSILFLLKDYLFFREYYHRKRGYWFALYFWHIGFYLIVSLHILSFLGALAILTGLSVSTESANILGRIIYYLTLVVGVGSFTTGSVGSIGVLIKRLADKDLRAFASPMNYFNYLFFLAVFLSGFYAWYFFDPTFSGYREFWKSLITFSPMLDMAPAIAAHIILFSLFLIYLPFTRSMHYVTRFFAFFWVRWDDKPNLRGSSVEKRVKKLLAQPVSWSASHIQSGRKWSEIVSEVKDTSETEAR